MERPQVLWLTAHEVLLLTDRVQNTDLGTEDQRVVPYLLLLKLGSLYVEAASNPSHPMPIAVTEAECWLLRSKVTSQDKTATDSLAGVKLLVKIYQALSAFQAETEGLLAADDDGQQLTEDMKRALKRRMGGD